MGLFWENVGKTEACGAEAEIRFGFDKHKYAYANLTCQKLKNTTHQTITSDEGQVYTQEDFDPGSYAEFMGNIGVNYDINDYVIANVSLNYVGKKKRNEEKIWDGETLIRKDQRDPVKARTLLNASVTFRNFFRGVEIQLSGFNLLDEDHRDPDADGEIENDVPRPGRSFTGRISYSF